MNTQLVRIEHTDGYGMFAKSDSNGDLREYSILEASSESLLCDLANRHQRFNNPWEDGLIFHTNHYCGYKSIDQLQQWIKPEEFKLLFELGYSIYLIEVSECQVGRDQVVFQKAHIVSKTDIDQLFI